MTEKTLPRWFESFGGSGVQRRITDINRRDESLFGTLRTTLDPNGLYKSTPDLVVVAMDLTKDFERVSRKLERQRQEIKEARDRDEQISTLFFGWRQDPNPVLRLRDNRFCCIMDRSLSQCPMTQSNNRNSIRIQPSLPLSLATSVKRACHNALATGDNADILRRDLDFLKISYAFH